MMNWKQNVRKVEPYVPGEQPQAGNVIKLNTNENPYPPAPGVEKLIKNMDFEKLRLYPDPDVSLLTCTLADYYGINKDQVFVGVGSDDVLAMSFLTFFNSDKNILFPDITYSFYDVWAELYRIPYTRPSLDENFRIKVNDYLIPNGGIVIANPNAPTSICEPLENIEKIIATNTDVVVIVDEAYIDFGGESALSLIKKYDNLLVVRTFSKSRSMAGLRIGFAMGNPALIEALNSVKLSYNSYTMNMPSILLGAEAVRDDNYFRKTLKCIIETRENTRVSLEELGFKVLDSKTNFLFVTHPELDAKEIFERLRANNIYVRYFNKPRIDEFLRISIGNDQEMQMLLDSLKLMIEI